VNHYDVRLARAYAGLRIAELFAIGFVGAYMMARKRQFPNYDAFIYVFTATNSLWGRFHAYFDTGHGGNRELHDRGRHPYRVSVLQIGSFDNEILDLESSWKVKLMTRDFGLNAN
jgi:hypothetical protein